MNSPPDAVYAVVRDTDPDTLDSGGLDAYLRRVAELRAWCDARQVRATRRQTDSGVPVPVETARRMACESDIIPVVLDGEGVVLDEGRAQRLATAVQRTAIEAMQSTCSHPDCTVTIDDCRVHHLRPWDAGDAGV